MDLLKPKGISLIYTQKQSISEKAKLNLCSQELPHDFRTTIIHLFIWFYLQKPNMYLVDCIYCMTDFLEGGMKKLKQYPEELFKDKKELDDSSVALERFVNYKFQ